jgi:hypothetical protein
MSDRANAIAKQNHYHVELVETKPFQQSQVNNLLNFGYAEIENSLNTCIYNFLFIWVPIWDYICWQLARLGWLQWQHGI